MADDDVGDVDVKKAVCAENAFGDVAAAVATCLAEQVFLADQGGSEMGLAAISLALYVVHPPSWAMIGGHEPRHVRSDVCRHGVVEEVLKAADLALDSRPVLKQLLLPWQLLALGTCHTVGAYP